VRSLALALLIGQLAVASVQAEVHIECGLPLDQALRLHAEELPPADGDMKGQLYDAAAVLVLYGPGAVFEGTLVKTTEGAPSSLTNRFAPVLLEFRDVRWYRGPAAGKRTARLFVASERPCDDDCPKQWVTRATAERRDIWMPTWLASPSQTGHKGAFGFQPEYYLPGVCGYQSVSQVSGEMLRRAINGHVNQMRRAAGF
jgi:hypothetical protein